MSSFLKRLLTYFLFSFASIVVLAAAFIVYIIWFQSPFYFPKPTGQYAVGMRSYHWIDTSRKELLNDDPAHPNRELMINIWYPAQGKLAEKPTMLYVPCIPYFQKNQTLAWLLVKYSRSIYSYAHLEAPIATDIAQFPVIIFSHGFGGTRDINTAQCEELASHGYNVVGISHTYDSSVVYFPDGRIVDGLKSMDKRLQNKKLAPKKLMLNDLEIWISDVRFVLDQLEQLANDNNSIFYQRFDQKNIGMFGHSFGGAMTIQICRRDQRVKAAVTLDSPLYGPDAAKNFDKPCMFMFTGHTIKKFECRPMDRNDWKDHAINSPEDEAIARFVWLTAAKQLVQSIGPDAFAFVIKNTAHYAFCDNVLLKDASLLSCFVGDLGAGKIDGFRATEIVNDYLVNFFDKYLKGKPSGLLDGGGKRYPEVEAKEF